MTEKPRGFIVCRRGTDPLKPGYTVCATCEICKKLLQVSRQGIERAAKENLIMLCNPCGFAMAERLQQAGQTLDKQYTPDFLRSFASYVEKGRVP